jgi:rhamnopyranosyl-N-acetylglucosaminyl-diphospho-decaprenol beta-1,3/1,4-galactofuranosyltransferase
MSDDFVVAVTATYERVELLKRLISSLSKAGPELGGLVVVDNSPGGTAKSAVNQANFEVVYCHPGQNLGCGAGLRLGMEKSLAHFGGRITHFLMLDDDAELPPNAVSSLLEVGRQANAEVMYPMIVNEKGNIGWFPGLLGSPTAWEVIRRVKTPEEYRKECGNTSLPFTWSTVICLLISRRAVNAVDLPADNFWVRGEDIEYSLRLTSRFKSAFVPSVVVRHLVPTATENNSRSEILKHLAMMQNLAFMGTRLPHGRAVLRHFPGNVYRFIRAHGLNWTSFKFLTLALWLGAVKGKPAGETGYNTFQQQFAELRSQ